MEHELKPWALQKEVSRINFSRNDCKFCYQTIKYYKSLENCIAPVEDQRDHAVFCLHSPIKTFLKLSSAWMQFFSLCYSPP